MKRILFVLVFLYTTYVQSQEKFFEEEVKKIAKKIEEITQKEKDSLKEKVIAINKKLEDREITIEEAKKLKAAAAALHALNIENGVALEERKLQQLVQDKTNGKIASNDEDNYVFNLQIFDKDFGIINKTSRKKRKKRKRKTNKRTTTQLVMAFGVNNVLTNNDLGSLENSNYKFWQSRSYELGFTWKTRLSKEASMAYFKYGFSFLWNNLRTKNNQLHILNGDNTDLATFNEQLTESRLRHVQMLFPMHLELDFSKNKKYEDGFVRDRRHKSFRIGLGGFFGLKLGTRQYLEYTNSNNVTIEEVQKNPFNTSIFNYGLSTYFAYKSYGVFLKYDLNPLFKNTNIRNISLGLRLDL